jgi:environmental stress-induced protein Ves
MQRFDLNQIPHSPWKNGGGSTREIVCFPPGAGMDSFGWRVSVATIAQAGPFSAFPGIDRQIMLLDGDGVQLVSAAAGIDHALQQRWQPFAFSGDAALDCSLLGGTSTDFNVMTRRGQWSAEVLVHDAAVRPGRSAAGLCLVLQGGFAQGRTVLQVGQGLWWDAAEDAEPLLPGDAHSRLVLVSLHPA